jgi:flagellar basal body-associated protein FliL
MQDDRRFKKNKIAIVLVCILVVFLATAAVCYFMDINPFSDSAESTTITTTTVVIDYTDPNRIAEPLPDGIEEPNWVEAPTPPVF